MAISKSRLELFVGELTYKLKKKKDKLYQEFLDKIREEKLKTIDPSVIKAWSDPKIKDYITTSNILYLNGCGFSNKSFGIPKIPSTNSYSVVLNQDNCNCLPQLYNQYMSYKEYKEYVDQIRKKTEAVLISLKTEKNIFAEFPELKKFEKKPTINTLPSAEDLTTLKNLLKQ